MQTIDNISTQVLTKEAVEQMAKEYNERPVAELRKELNELHAEFKGYLAKADRSGEDGQAIYDFSKVDAWKDKSEGERMTAFMEANDKLNVMGAVLHEKEFMVNFAGNLDRVSDATGDNPMFTADQVQGLVRANVGQATSLSSIMERQPEYKSQIMDANYMQRKGRGVNMTGITPEEIYAAVFQKSGVTDSGWNPQIPHSGRLVEAPTRPEQLVQFLPRIPATNGGWVYAQEQSLSAESTSGRAPSEKAEGAAAAELKLEVENKTVQCKKVVGILPVTDEQLADESGARAYIDLRVPQQILQRVDRQAILGDGSGANLDGLLSFSGINTFAATSSDTIIDVLLKGIGEIRTDTYGYPNLCALPWAHLVKILQAKNTGGDYIYGSPASQSVLNTRVWGMPFVVNDSLAANTGLLINTADKFMVLQGGMEIVYGLNSDDFAKGQTTVRGTIRVNFADVKVGSTCTITALNQIS